MGLILSHDFGAFFFGGEIFYFVERMLPFEDYYQEQLAKTSPVHRPVYYDDFSFNYAIQTPISAPVSSFDFRSGNDRVIDIKENLSLEDIMNSYEAYNQLEQQNKARQNEKILQKKPKKKQITFKPFVSFEATELTVHQLQSVFNKMAKQKKTKVY